MNKRKRRKLEKDNSDSEGTSIQKDIKSRLTHFKKIDNDKNGKITGEYLSHLLRNEKMEVLRGIHEKYELDPKRVGSRNWIKAVVSLFFHSYHDIRTKRKFESDNISSFDSSKRVVLRMNGISLPEDVLREILSYLHSSYDLITTLGRTCKKLYLLILSNWNSRITIWYDDNEYSGHSSKKTNLYQISLLIIRSMRDVVLSNISEKRDMDYLLSQFKGGEKNNRIKKLTFRNCKFEDILLFFVTAKEKGIQITDCQSIEFPNFQVVPKNDEFVDLLFSVVPNHRFIKNPIYPMKETGYSRFSRILGVCSEHREGCFDILNLHPGLQRKLKIFKYFPDLTKEHNHITTYNETLKNIVHTFTNLESLHISTSTNSDDSNLHLNWNFLKNNNGNQNDHLHTLQIKFKRFNWYRSRRISNFHFYLPTSIRKLDFMDPPISFLRGLNQEGYWEARPVEEISITFSSYLHFWESFNSSEEEKVAIGNEIQTLEELAQILIPTDTEKKKKYVFRKVKILCYNDKIYGQGATTYVDFIRIETSLSLRKVKLFIFNKRIASYGYRRVEIGVFSKSLLQQVKQMKISPRNYDDDDDGFYDNIIVYHFENYYTSCESELPNLLPEGVVEDESERWTVRNKENSFIRVPNSCNLHGYVSFERKSYYRW